MMRNCITTLNAKNFIKSSTCSVLLNRARTQHRTFQSSNLSRLPIQHSMEEYFHLGHILCDQHVKKDEQSIALNYLTSDGKFQYTFKQLSDYSEQFGQFLKSIGLKKQDRISILLPKCPELMISGLAIWRNAMTYVPLFTAFGPDAIAHRVFDSESKVIITDETNRAKLDPIMSQLEERGVKIIIVEKGIAESMAYRVMNGNAPLLTSLSSYRPNDYRFWNSSILAGQKKSTTRESTGMDKNDIMVLLYTSGTTGKSKGVPVSVKALGSFEVYMKYGLHVTENDVFLNIADPGWAYGLYYNVLGTLLLGTPTYFVNRSFNPQTIYEILQNEKVTNFAAAPTAYRAMKAQGPELAQQYKFYLRKASSAGEALNNEVVSFFENIWGIRINNHYGQSEHGMLINCHHHPEYTSAVTSDVTTMGQPIQGFTVTLLDDDFKEITEPHVSGHLVIDVANSPSRFFTGYLNQPEKTEEKMIQSPSYSDGRLFEMTGDRAYRDENGLYFFSGRSDDIITSCGYRISPKEVEDCLQEHEAIFESGVVGQKDELRTELVVAFVVLRPGYQPSKKLEQELSEFVKKKLSAHQYPRRIFFEDKLPCTEAGKIKRNVLRDKVNAMPSQ